MTHRIDGPSNINNNVSIGLNKVSETSAQKINSSFGDGFGNLNATKGLSVERSIPGLEDLLTKFDFEVPKYEKNIAQLTINDRDYIPDKPFEEEAFCEV